MGLTAVVAVLQVAVLAARVSGRPPQHSAVCGAAVLMWSPPATGQRETPAEARRAPSHPVQTYCVGQLELTCGMAVVALASWLHIMRAGSVHSH